MTFDIPDGTTLHCYTRKNGDIEMIFTAKDHDAYNKQRKWAEVVDDMNPDQKRWLEIAGAYLTPENEATPKQVKIACDGLCVAADKIGIQFNRNSVFSLEVMLNPGCPAWWWPTRNHSGLLKNSSHTESCDHERALLACIIATMPPEIYNDFTEDL